ncbi:uncharacterized protein LOC136026923 [Artemia franciscana]|uniref:uncharacterized protein LOC136026923 n=1 Tax=Artemia franciscana TaxID=6661 RepID=UPI0032DB3039
MKVLVFTSLCVAAAIAAYPANNYGAGVPELPPLGAAAQHPRYGHGHAGYGDQKYGNDYVIARRYESSTRGPNGVESAYAYQVDGQTVQVARRDQYHKGYGYNQHH